MIYSNPRTLAVFEDWPHGAHRTRCTFEVEANPKRGERVARVTIDPKSGRPSAPKRTTFARAARIVDGDDGRTYVAELSIYGHVSIVQSNLQFQQEVIHSGDARYDDVRALFEGV